MFGTRTQKFHVLNTFYLKPQIHFRNCSYNKTNEKHKFLKFISGIELYMFRRVSLSIIRSQEELASSVFRVANLDVPNLRQHSETAVWTLPNALKGVITVYF